MFFFTYKTTNLVNGKYYFGRHSSVSLEDGYLGSGIALKNAVKKYGVENFQREILAFYPTKESLVEAEKELIKEEVVNDKMSYNMKIGGWGGSSSEEWTQERRNNHSMLAKERMKSAELRKGVSERAKKMWQDGKGITPPNVSGIKRSDETKGKISKSHKGMKKKWVTNTSKKGTKHSEETRRKMSESRKRFLERKDLNVY